jgi:transcriptional regulator with XRE-family HTH domain
MSTRQLAEAVGISNAAVTKLEKDQSKSPSADNLYKLAIALKTEPQYLLYGERRFSFAEGVPLLQSTRKWPFSVPQDAIDTLSPRDFAQLDRIIDAFVAGCTPSRETHRPDQRRKAG